MGAGEDQILLTERDAEIVRLHREGVGIQAIGDRFGLSGERVRQIVKKASPRTTRTARSGERVRLRIGNLGKAVLVSGQAYQDPKDALNEFVSNAADEYMESGRRGERIAVILRRKGKRPVIAVDDVGRGMDPDRLRQVARSLFDSAKAGDSRTLGEKAIGLLAFQQLGGSCDIVSRAAGHEETWTLRLERGSADAALMRERRRARQVAGTTVYLSDLDPEALRVLTQRKVVDYLRRRRSAALTRGDYSIEVVEGRTSELVTAEEPEGIRLELPARATLWGRIEFALYVAVNVDRHRRVAVVGRAGTTVIDDVAELEEFDHEPWTSGQVSGLVVFEALQQTAGRRALIRDRDAFPVFRDALQAVEPLVTRTVERVRQEVDANTADRLADTVRKVFGRVLKELADLENPMRTLVGTEAGTGALLEQGNGSDSTGSSHSGGRGDDGEPTLQELRSPASPNGDGRGNPSGGDARPQHARNLPSLEPDPNPGLERSRFDPDSGTVFYNESHADFLMVKDEESSLLDYLSTLVAKEYVVYNNPRAAAGELAEEMVRMLVRVRRHLPKRR
jgi:histidine kinase/DNA gyrase B/HSP90-like ATPase/sigma-70-like protein